MVESENLHALPEKACWSPMAHGEHRLDVHQPGDAPDLQFRCPGRETAVEE